MAQGRRLSPFGQRARWPLRAMALPATILALVPSAASQPDPRMPGVPANGVLEFAIVREGDTIGHNRMRFSRQGDRLTVDMTVDITVRFAFITIYRFRQQAREVWRDGRLVFLHSTTDDDGHERTVRVTKDGNGLKLGGDVQTGPLPRDLVTSTLWNPALLARNVLISPATGERLAIEARFLGEETVPAGGRPVRARHYAVTGELERELWYDEDGVLVHVRFEGSDGSEIRWVRR